MFPAATILTTVASGVASMSVGKVVSEIVKSNTNPITTLEKIQVAVGTTVLSAALGTVTTTYVAKTANEVIEVAKKFRQKPDIPAVQ